MKKFLALLVLSLLSVSHAIITPSQVINLIIKKTDLYTEGSAACDERENFFRQSTYPTDAQASDKFVKTFKYTSDNIFGVYAKSQLESAVASYSDLKWASASWHPWRRFDTVGISEMIPYTFYVEVVEPKTEDYDTIDFTSICITVTALRK